MIRAFEYTATELKIPFAGHTDSESVLKTVEKFLGFPYYYPNLTMSSDWDAIQALCSSIRELVTTPELLHVRGHQDKHIEKHKLPLPAQLNIEADELAGNYSYPDTIQHTRVPLIAGNACQLNTQRGTITYRMKNVIRKIAAEPKMIKHLCEQNKWSKEDFELIDWEAHGMSVRKHYHNKKFVTKFVRDWLPTGSLIVNYDAKYIAKCPSCEHEYEDREHFLKCPARAQWQRDLLQDLRKQAANRSTNTQVLDILLEGLRSWFDDSDFWYETNDNNLQKLIAHQNRIGWDQLVFGRFASDWRVLHTEQLNDIKNTEKHNSGKTWITFVTAIIWKHTFVNWEVRNGMQHGIDFTSREKVLIEQAKRETEALYEIKNQVAPNNQELYYHSVEHHYEQEPTARGLRQWINTWKPVLLKSAQTAATKGINGIRSISTYFQREQQ